MAELKARYELREDFIERLRAPVALILSEEIPRERRRELLELLAETCERDVKIRREGANLRSAFQELFRVLGDLNEKLRKLGGGLDSPPAGFAG